MRIHKRQSASMNAKMDEIISDIGNLMMDTADIEFVKAWLYVEAEEGAIRTISEALGPSAMDRFRARFGG